MSEDSRADVQMPAILARLDVVAKERPDLAEALVFYRTLLPVLCAAQQEVQPLSLDSKTVLRKLGTGQPLLTGENLAVDPAVQQALFIRLCRVLEEAAQGRPRSERGHPAPSGRPAGRGGSAAPEFSVAMSAAHIRSAAQENRLDVAALVRSLAGGNRLPLEMAAAGLSLDYLQLETLVLYTLRAFLRGWTDGLRQEVDTLQWRHGICPVCGNPPVFSELQATQGERHLRCSLCGADWLYPRLQCAFCACDDYRELGYIAVDGEQHKYHIQSCDACHDYSKMIATFEPTPVPLLLLEDLLSAHLDQIATQRGYRHGEQPARGRLPLSA